MRAWKGVPELINPLLAGATLKKTDVKDASRLAQMSLAGVWRAFYVPSDDVSAIRVLIAERSNYSMLASRSTNRINSTLLRFGITVGRSGSVAKNRNIRAVVMNLISDTPAPTSNICPTGIPDSVKLMIRDEYASFDASQQMIAKYETEMLSKVESLDWETKDNVLDGKKMLTLLMTVPGVGKITASIWLANVITPRRFPNAKACSAYAGLDPSVQISAKHVTGRLIRKGNKDLHSALIQSASILMKDHKEPIGRWGYQLYLQTGRWKKAVNAVARRLSVSLYYVQLLGVPFSYEKYHLINEVTVMDISIDILPELNPEFKRYIKLLKENSIDTTAQLATAYYTYEVAKIKGIGKKFYGLVKDFINNQKEYVAKYRELHPVVDE